MTISTVKNVNSELPISHQKSNRTSNSMINRLTSKVGLAAIAAVVLSSIPSVGAGPVAYGVCCAACGPAMLACFMACVPLLGCPCP